MNSDQVKGVVKKAVGKIQRKTGQAVGSPSQEVKGATKQAEGTAQKAVGDVKQDLKSKPRAI